MSKLYTSIYPYQRTQERYETDNILITSDHYTANAGYTGTGGYVSDLIFPGRHAAVCNGYDGKINITFEFKNNIQIIPKAMHLLSMGNEGCSGTLDLYCIDATTNEETLLASKTITKTSGSGSWSCYDTDITLDTNILTSKLIVRFVCHGVRIQHLSYDFEIDQTSQMIKNKVEHVIMQNTLFQKVISNAEIIED